MLMGSGIELNISIKIVNLIKLVVYSYVLAKMSNSEIINNWLTNS